MTTTSAPSTCGNASSLEAIASGPHTVEWAQSQGFTGTTGEDLAARYAAGDPIAKEAIVRTGTAEPGVERIETPGELPLLAEVRTFVEHLAGGPPPRSSAAEGLAVVEALAALRRMAGVS